MIFKTLLREDFITICQELRIINSDPVTILTQ